MTTCRRIQAELSAYMDNEVSPATRALVEEHVRDCQHCQERLTELKALAAGVTALPRLQPPPQFLSAVRRKIARDGKSPTRAWQDYLFRPLWLKVPLEALAAAVVVALVMRFEFSGKTGESGGDQAAATVHQEDTAPPPAAAGGEAHLIQKLVPSRPVGGASPLVVTTGSPPSPAVAMVVLHVKDFDDGRSRVQQVAAAMHGRVVLPSEQQVAAGTLFVELPQTNVAAFKLRLSQVGGRTAAQAVGKLAVEPGAIGDKAATTLLQIQIVTD